MKNMMIAIGLVAIFLAVVISGCTNTQQNQSQITSQASAQDVSKATDQATATLDQQLNQAAAGVSNQDITTVLNSPS